ncbi:MAG: hypothetical protein J7518_13460 [Nocardioidaceae bacterium]|nr:hypothetical protein [Nocardioidaceae bacterium]
MAATRSSARRRQRSVRVTVAVALLGVATVAVLLALPTQSPALLSVSSVAAVALGWAALRIVWTEVLQSRRENAADRAAAANAYRSLFTERAAEHAEFTTAMTERLAASNLSVRELQGALVQSQQLAAAEKVRAETAEAATVQAQQRVAELEKSIELLREEAAAVTDVEDLVAFDEQVAQVVKEATQDKKAKLA